MATKLARALARFHGQGYVHCEINPDTVVRLRPRRGECSSNGGAESSRLDIRLAESGGLSVEEYHVYCAPEQLTDEIELGRQELHRADVRPRAMPLLPLCLLCSSLCRSSTAQMCGLASCRPLA